MSYGCCIPIPRRRISDEHDHIKVKVIIELAPAPSKEKGSKKFWKREIREKVLQKCKQLDHDLTKELQVNLSKVRMLILLCNKCLYKLMNSFYVKIYLFFLIYCVFFFF